jgi:hypothetical protein
MQQIIEMLAEMKADAKANQEDLLTRMEAKIDASRESDREQMLAEISARMDISLNEMREEIKSGQAEMRSIICTFWSELKDTIQHEMRAAIQSVQSELDETTTCREATETEPNPGMMQSIEEHQEIPKGEASKMPVGGPRKRRRVRNPAAECRQMQTERPRGYCGSRRKLAAACKKVTRCAKVAW